MLSRRIVQSRTSNLDLDAPGCLGNVDRLDTHLMVDNVRFAPCAFMVASDVNIVTGAWASRHDVTKTLSVTGSGTDPTYGNATAIENSSVKYASAQKYHIAANTTWAQLTDKDFALEFLYIHKADTENLPYKTWNGTRGYSLYNNGANQTTIYFNDGSTSIQGVALTAPVAGAIYHIVVLGDRSENLYTYVNGVMQESRALTGLSGNLSTGSGNLQFGYAGAAELLLFAAWDLSTNPFPGALKNRTYFDKIVRERFALVAGIQDRRQGAHTFTRATPAYLDKWTPGASTKSLYRVSAGWPRVCERDDANSKRVRRYLAEPQITNLCIQSEDLATTWTAHNLTTVSSNAAVAPNGETTADGVVGDASDTTHGANQALTLPATMHCFSTHAKPGDKDWIHLTTGITNVSGYFDVANGVVGTIGAAVTASGIEPHPYLNGYYRCWINFTGSADSKSYYLLSAQADGDNTFAGDTTTINTYFWGTQIEATAEHFPSSYIPTAAAAVARNKDELTYNIRLPIVSNLDDLPQALTIGGTDYDPVAFLVADDCQVDGTWLSRHDVSKTLAFVGAGTNPTLRWDNISRANKSIKYWTSNLHQAADKTWGQLTTGDWVVELIAAPGLGVNTMFMSNVKLAAPISGLCVYRGSGLLVIDPIYDGTEYASTIAYTTNAPFHLMVFGDKSDKYYSFLNGIYINSTSLAAVATDFDCEKLAIGAHPTTGSGCDHQIFQMGLWDLPTNPFPGSATNQAVMGAIARARFDQQFQPVSMRLDCEILHPNVNRQTKVSLVDISVNQLDYNSLMIDTDDYGLAQAAYNNTWSWNSSTTKGSTDVCDNVSRKLSIAARENNARYKEDNTTIASDTSCEVPTAHTTVRVGMWADNNFQPSCLVGGVKLWRSDK